MRTLYHLALSPQSRLIRLVLGEKRMEVHLRAEPVWERRDEFLAINPAGEVPVLVEDDGSTVAGSQAIAEYLEECDTAVPLLPGATANSATPFGVEASNRYSVAPLPGRTKRASPSSVQPSVKRYTSSRSSTLRMTATRVHCRCGADRAEQRRERSLCSVVCRF